MCGSFTDWFDLRGQYFYPAAPGSEIFEEVWVNPLWTYGGAEEKSAEGPEERSAQNLTN